MAVQLITPGRPPGAGPRRPLAGADNRRARAEPQPVAGPGTVPHLGLDRIGASESIFAAPSRRRRFGA